MEAILTNNILNFISINKENFIYLNFHFLDIKRG